MIPKFFLILTSLFLIATLSRGAEISQSDLTLPETQNHLPQDSDGRLSPRMSGLLPFKPVEFNSEISGTSSNGMTLDSFLKKLADSNLDYAAQKFNVPIADAQISVAKIYPNPTLSGGYTTDISNQHLSDEYTAGLSEEILLGGKLGAKKEVAMGNARAARSQLDDYFRTLRGTATSAFIDVLSAKLARDRQKASLDSLDQLVKINEKRFSLGDVAEVDVLQAKVAAFQARSDFLASESTLRTSIIALQALLGKKTMDDLPNPVGNLEMTVRSFQVDQLVTQAVMQRSDVIAARDALEVAHANLNLTKANRVSDLTVGIDLQHTTASTNEIAPYPESNALGFTLSAPIPFSNFITGDVEAAKLTEKQAAITLQSAQVKAETDVKSAYTRYQLAIESLSQYKTEILQDADKVLKAKLYSYKRGSASLLEVLDAQQTLNQTYLSYYTALTEQAKALVALEESSGIWNINF